VLRTKLQCCPECNHELDAAECEVGERELIEKDDISICVYCLAILTFDERLNLRKLADAELEELPTKMKDYIKLAKQMMMD
jgi:hypothetical protein